jgi:hypothetical protein
MALEIVYSTLPGGEDPVTYIQGQPPEEAANLFRWIETFADTPPGEWPRMKSKRVAEHLWQHNQGAHRVLFAIRAGELIVLHAFRKAPRKEEQAAYRLAEQRFEDYVKSH